MQDLNCQCIGCLAVFYHPYDNIVSTHSAVGHVRLVYADLEIHAVPPHSRQYNALCQRIHCILARSANPDDITGLLAWAEVLTINYKDVIHKMRTTIIGAMNAFWAEFIKHGFARKFEIHRITACHLKDGGGGPNCLDSLRKK